MSVSPVCSCLSCPTHRGSPQGPACGFYPSSSMTDAQWELLEPLLPPAGNTGGHGGRPEKYPRRRMLDAIFYVVRGGIAWSALPAEFPPAKTVYGLFRRWVRAGAWIRLHDALRDRARIAAGRHPLPTAAVIDSASVRGADTVPARSRGYDAASGSTAANGTSPWTPAGCCWPWWSASPASRTVMVRCDCWPRCGRSSPPSP